MQKAKYPGEAYSQDARLHGAHSQKQLTQKKNIHKEQIQINTFIYKL